MENKSATSANTKALRNDTRQNVIAKISLFITEIG